MGIFGVLPFNALIANYVEDENGFLIQKTEELLEITGNHEIERLDYQNFCDGNPKMMQLTYVTNPGKPSKRTHYEYLNGVDCDFENEQLSIKIYPNPSNGIFKIKGDLLGGASTKIKVLNFVGQLIFEIKVPEQSYIYDLDYPI